MEFLRDPVWIFVGVLIGLIPVLYLIMNRRRKELSYYYDVRELIPAHSEIGGKIDLVWQGGTVDNVQSIFLKLHNTGNRPIERGDFDRYLGVRLNEDCKIIDVSLDEVQPKNINPTFEVSEHGITIKPTMLNKDDYFILKILATGFRDGIELDTRIIGIKELSYLGNIKQFRSKSVFDFLLPISAGYFVAVIMFDGLNVPKLEYRLIVYLLGGIYVMVFFYMFKFGLLKIRRIRKLIARSSFNRSFFGE